MSARTNDHVAVVALVGYEGVEGDGVEHHPPVPRVLRHRAAHGWKRHIVTVGEKREKLREKMSLREHSGNSVGLQDPSA